MSLVFLKLLSHYVSSPQLTNKKQLGVSSTIKNNSIFKYLALMAVASVILSVLIDYNLKLAFVADIDPKKIADITNMIFIISTANPLVVSGIFY